MINRITAFLGRVTWLAHYTGNPVTALSFLLRRRKNMLVTTNGQYHGQPFTFRGSDMNAVREVLTLEEYQFLRPLLQSKPAPVVYDIGAHVGLFALWCLQQNPQARVYSLEANPSTFAVLAGNVAKRGSANWQSLNRAAWKNNDTIMFNSLAESMSSHVSSTGTTAVQGINWDSLIQQWPAEVDIMKIDIEGAEEAFVAGNPHMLDGVANLVIELHPNRCDSSSIQRLLEERYASVVNIGGRLSTKPLLFCTQPRAAVTATAQAANA